MLGYLLINNNQTVMTELFFPSVNFEYQFHYCSIGTKDGREYMCEYDDSTGKYGKVVEKYSPAGHQIVVIDYFSPPYKKSKIDEYVKWKLEMKKTELLVSCSSLVGGSTFTSTLDSIAEGDYKDIPYMTMDEFDEKRKFLTELKEKFTDSIKYYPCVYTLDKSVCTKLVEIDGIEYWSHNDKIMQLYKQIENEIIVIDYFSPPIVEEHVNMFKRNNVYTSFFPFNSNTKKTLEAHSKEFTSTYTTKEIEEKRNFLKKLNK